MSASYLNKGLDALVADMIDATERTFSINRAEMRPFIETGSKRILDAIKNIEFLKESGVINEMQAALQMDVQKEAYKSLLLTIEGVRSVQAENAVNAGLSVIRDTVNRLLGWSLL